MNSGRVDRRDRSVRSGCACVGGGGGSGSQLEVGVKESVKIEINSTVAADVATVDWLMLLLMLNDTRRRRRANHVSRLARLETNLVLYLNERLFGQLVDELGVYVVVNARWIVFPALVVFVVVTRLFVCCCCCCHAEIKRERRCLRLLLLLSR